MIVRPRLSPLFLTLLSGVLSLSVLVFAAYLTVALVRFPTIQPGASAVTPSVAVARHAIIDASTTMRSVLSGHLGELTLRSGGTLGDALANRAPRSVALGVSASIIALVITAA